jgi:hypothetical protein
MLCDTLKDLAITSDVYQGVYERDNIRRLYKGIGALDL